MGADPLSEVLRAVRLTGAVFFTIDASAPWVVEAPAPRGRWGPAPHAPAWSTSSSITPSPLGRAGLWRGGRAAGASRDRRHHRVPRKETRTSCPSAPGMREIAGPAADGAASREPPSPSPSGAPRAAAASARR